MTIKLGNTVISGVAFKAGGRGGGGGDIQYFWEGGRTLYGGGDLAFYGGTW